MEARIIRIACNRRHGSDLFQRQDNGRHADVAPVQDMVHAREEVRDERVEVVVRVRDDTDLEHGA